MGATRNGARSFLDVIAKACQLSRLPGFRLGLSKILGPTEAGSLFPAWDALCLVVDGLIAGDNWYNKVDHDDTSVGDQGEDIVLA